MKTRQTLLSAWFLILLYISAAAQSAGESPAARVDKIFEIYDKPTSPGCALAVIQNGQIFYKRGYGMADLDHDVAIRPDTVFHVASVSKQFTAMSILLLAKEGKLTLDDEVRKYIPELRDFGHMITIRHLLHHTSGLRDQWNLLIMSGWRLSEDVVRDEDVLDLVSRMKELNFKPGDQHLYSNTGYTLAAIIVKRVSGKSLREFADERIFKPLGMAKTFFRDDHAVIVKNQAYAYNPGLGGAFKLSVPNYDTVGASSLLTTVEDLAKWDQNFYDKTVGDTALIDLMQTTTTLNNGDKFSYALGLSVSQYKGLNVVEHSGGDAGYRSHLMRFPDQRFSVACLCNFGGANPSMLARRVADVYLDKMLAADPARKPLPDAPILSEAELARWAGVYWDARAEEIARLKVENGKLVLSVTGLNAALLPETALRFSIPEPAVIVDFEEPTAGRAQKMTLKMAARSPIVFEAMAPADADPARLPDFAGNYYSEEIDSTYTVAVKEGKLVLRRKKAAEVAMTPAFRDAFSTLSILGTIRFTRDAQNRVDGFRLSAGRIRNFKFVKLLERP